MHVLCSGRLYYDFSVISNFICIVILEFNALFFRLFLMSAVDHCFQVRGSQLRAQRGQSLLERCELGVDI